jgi:hypothetical protein
MPIALSFSDTPFVVFPPQGFTVQWYAKVLNEPDFTTPFMFSVQLGLFSAAGALLLGTPTAMGLVRHQFPSRGIVQGLVLSPLVFPMLVTGIALLRVWQWRKRRRLARARRHRGGAGTSVIAAGGEPAQSTFSLAARWLGHVDHEESMLNAGRGGGRYVGCCPRLKVSMMIMRPPQQGQGCCGVFGCSGLVLAALMASIGMSGTASKSRARAMLRARAALLSRP